MELYLTFLEPHRIRYIKNDNTIVHDEHVQARYEFTTTEGSHRFQGDLRGQDLIDFFDIDVIWSDKDSRTDSFGSVRGIGAIQRMKMWRDRYTTYHYLTFYANRTSRRYREYYVCSFESEIKNCDDSHRRLRLTVRGRRGSVPDSSSSGSSSGPVRRFSMTSLRQRPRNSNGQGSLSHAASHTPSHASSSRSLQSKTELASTPSSSASSPSTFALGTGLDIRYLGIQFSRAEDYFRFMEQWRIAEAADSEFCGVPFPSDCFELPSPEILPGDSSNFTSPPLYSVIVEETTEEYDPRES
ncbi:hypothetical protein SEPCBS119000_002637 [Sporothrix epigloea]|uniref:Acetate kinase n=1 Tax=Sporothrix epigloea TaxID=1892477 RepID=A0ABP0DKQ4_9PEZI